jgi:small-conductance mechanosensitive channel
LFAGIFIIADAPYKVGDFIVLEGDLRGRVTSIGIRSTRILTLDDVEITVPNAIIGNSMLINEVGGPAPKQRLKISVQAAYGSDVDEVEKALLSAADNEPLVCESPKPTVRFRSFGDSGLDFWLLVWVDDAARREELAHILNKKVYRAFAEHGIQIPFPQRDVHIKEAPSRSAK